MPRYFVQDVALIHPDQGPTALQLMATIHYFCLSLPPTLHCSVADVRYTQRESLCQSSSEQTGPRLQSFLLNLNYTVQIN